MQVRDILVERVLLGTWQPGTLIPNEVDLSRELGVSIGTIRKALEQLESECVVHRRQGRGTFVVDPERDDIGVRFEILRTTDGRPINGKVSQSAAMAGEANKDESKALCLDPQEQVLRLRRIRYQNNEPFLVEYCTLPKSFFPNLQEDDQVPDRICSLASRYRVLIARASERISISSVQGEVAGLLECLEGTPLLKLERLVYAQNGKPIELRVSLCQLGGAYCLAKFD